MSRSSTWRPGRDRRAVRHAGSAGAPRLANPTRPVVVAGGGIAGIAAAAALAERGVPVVLVEPQPTLGGRVRARAVEISGPAGTPQRATMSRGFHAFFRQYYNLRALLRRVDPALDALVPVEDYPLVLADGHADSFARIPRTPPWNLLAFVAQSPSFGLADLGRVNVAAALELLDVDFPGTFSAYDGESAAAFLDRLRFPDGARHLALEVFARSFFANPQDFSAGELVGMFHTYFLGSSEGLLFDVPRDDYDTTLWAPLGCYLESRGVDVRTGEQVVGIDLSAPGSVRVQLGMGELEAAGVVVATDAGTTRALLLETDLGDQQWRDRVAETRLAPPFAVWRLWLDRHVNSERPPFLGTSNYGPLDNISVLERFEDGARRWSQTSGGSVVELHAYALPGWPDRAELQATLRGQLDRIYPELADAETVHQEWLVAADCPLSSSGPWQRRLTVDTPDPRVVLAGDGIRCDYPVALMERAATTGFLAANHLLAAWGVAGHDLWSVPMRSRQSGPGRVRQLLAAR